MQHAPSPGEIHQQRISEPQSPPASTSGAHHDDVEGPHLVVMNKHGVHVRGRPYDCKH